jgi:hypothetical protein
VEEMHVKAVKLPQGIIGAVCLLLVALVSAAGASDLLVSEFVNRPPRQVAQSVLTTQNEDAYYDGRLRVYVVEQVSRWTHLPSGDHYDFGFLDFALDSVFSIPEDGLFDYAWTWDASSAGYGDIEAGNIMVMAAVFNPESHPQYSDPPTNLQPFDAYYVDAAAAATPGSPGVNESNQDFTHTTFIECASMTWCPYDTLVMDTLQMVYESGDYPFYYTWFVMDSNDVALDRMANDYNVFYFPVEFIDGGDEVILGLFEEGVYRDAIEKCGGRDVVPLSLHVSVDWAGGGLLNIRVKIGPGGAYITGDADGSGTVDIDDVVYLIAYIFSGGPPPIPYLAGDADCSGTVDIDDVVYLINYIFSGGPPPGDPDGDSVPDC